MFLIGIAAYTVLACVAALVIEATEARIGQHLGMGAITYLSVGYVIPLILPPSLAQDDLLMRIFYLLASGATLGFIAYLASFVVYTVNGKQAAIYGLSMGVGHILLALLFVWAFST